MKTRAAAVAVRQTHPPFLKGQVWRIGDVNLLVTSVGKTLVHYKRYKTQPKGVQVTLSSKPDLERLLRNSKAILLAQ